MLKLKNICKRSLCIFLSVIILFFGVSNSYFSPHKMDTSEAACIVIGGTVCISVEFVIAFACVIGIFCLGAGIIDEMSDMDLNAVLNDVHDWLRENIDILDIFGITDGSSALKTWAEADSWEVVEGTGGSAPNPSPSPKKISLPDPFNIVNLSALGGLAGQQFYANTHKLPKEFVKVGQAYVDDKIKNFRSSSTILPTDFISQALIKRYGTNNGYFSGYEEPPKLQADGKYHYTISATGSNNQTITASLVSEDSKIGGWLERKPSEFFINQYIVAWGSYVHFYDSNGNQVYRDSQDSAYYLIENKDGSRTERKISCSFPIFNSKDDYHAWQSGEYRDILNKNNYIDTDDDYGWASTANISPNDLAQAMAGLADNLTDKPVSLQGLYAAINALKAQLEDKNPNVSGNTPVPFPTVDDYKNIFESIINDPDIFPDKNPNPVPSTDPNPKPSTNPNPDDKPVTDYTGFLSIIIDLLRSILQAVKDIIALLVNWFVLDIDAIKEHLLDAISKLPNISGFDSLFDIIRRFQGAITNDYKYPVISMRTPDILKPYYNQPEIILLDFKDYATYFIWVRTILAFSICFGFALWIVKDIKIAFTLN